MNRGTCAALLLAAALFGEPACAQQVHGLHRNPPSPHEFGGYFETRFATSRLDRDSALYRTDFAGHPDRSSLDRGTGTLKLTGRYDLGEWSFGGRAHASAFSDQLEHESERRFDELRATWRPATGLRFDFGKQVLRWGQGHAFGVVGFAERARDPNDPRLAREGYTMATAHLERSYAGDLRSVAFTPVLIPVTPGINDDYGRTGRINAGGRLNVVYLDTDLNVSFMNNSSRPGRVGIDFSRDVVAGIELYGEWARIAAQDFRYAAADGSVVRRREPVSSHVLGLRWQAPRRHSVTVEYYRNGTGYTGDELRNFASLVDSAVAAGPGSALMERARSLADGSFDRTQALRSYLYVRLAHGQPIGPLRLLPSIRAIVNTGDRSYSFTPELLTAAHGPWTFRLRVGFYGGGPGTDYGEKRLARRAELMAHLHF